MGDVMGDINSRRGRIEGMESRTGVQVIRGFVPLAECLAMPPTFVQKLRVEVYTLCSSPIMKKYQRASLRKLWKAKINKN